MPQKNFKIHIRGKCISMRIIKVILFLMKKVHPSLMCLIWVRKRRQDKCIMNYLNMCIEIYRVI